MDKKTLSLAGGRLTSGMTMVELVIVIAIIALLALVIGGLYLSWFISSFSW